MNNISCSKLGKCPLFNNHLLKRQESAETYKKLYCLNADRFRSCKRYIISDKVGLCAPYVLPNSFDTVEYLLEKMKKDKYY